MANGELMCLKSVFLVFVVFSIISCAICDNGSYTPIVLWHGMGDTCCFPFSLGAVTKRLNQSLPGIHVVSLKIGPSIVKDMENAYFMHPDKQVNAACETIKADPLLANGYNAIGFSQGSQFLRALVQRCPTPRVKNLISLGGQHQGVYGLPNCGSLSSNLCDYMRRLLNRAAYLGWVQKALVQATYWHDPLNELEYQNYSTFLADINNERTINLSYIKNLQQLDNFVMVKFENDTIVQPVETEWFGFYKPGQSKEIETLQESALFIDDRLGLQKMMDESKLRFLQTPGNHLQFDWPWFEENIINTFLKN